MEDRERVELVELYLYFTLLGHKIIHAEISIVRADRADTSLACYFMDVPVDGFEKAFLGADKLGHGDSWDENRNLET